ncbi:MAG: helix-turn-helix domain-containing protein [Chloroflexales bacterium]|nr:helix-turn-helix domain-containing protein [Chloroflexales bacterium]
MVDRTLVHLINTTLDRERRLQQLPNDSALARHLGISSKTLSLWRNGKSIPKAAVILVRLVAHHSTL